MSHLIQLVAFPPLIKHILEYGDKSCFFFFFAASEWGGGVTPSQVPDSSGPKALDKDCPNRRSYSPLAVPPALPIL